MVLVKNRPFFHLFFLANIGQENVFYDILHRKHAFLGYKNRKLKKSKNWDFSKEVNPWFWSKIGHFYIFFFLRQYRQGKCVLRYSRTKKSLSRLEKKKFKKSKNWDFSKGFNRWFRSKIGHFSMLFFFREYRPGKCVLRYSKTKTRLSKL